MGYSPRGRRESDTTERLHFHGPDTALGFPDISVGKESACNAGDPGSIPGSGRFPWRRQRLQTPVFCPREFHGLYSPVSQRVGHNLVIFTSLSL